MKRKYLLILIVLVILVFVIFLGYNIYMRINLVIGIDSYEVINTTENEIQKDSSQTLNIIL